jgi:glycosyltransferase involved in cell wall biosynthesis
MRITLVTDAWLPQVNGVTTTLGQCVAEIDGFGHSVQVISPDRFRTVPCPRYPEIRLALGSWAAVHSLLEDHHPNAIHIATEGPLGLAVRHFCRRRRLPFTTSFHTKFPDYIRAYAGVPKTITYRVVRWFHGAAERTLVPTPSIQHELEDRGFDNIVCWTRGVDTELFRPREDDVYGLPRPIFLYAGRVAVEKNLEAFLALDLPGSKVVVGDGPAKPALETRYPDVYWAGFRFGDELACHYAGADVFVFPSRTDTFGVVMLEANACGLPVAAFPVPGPLDVVQQGLTGVLHGDLKTACLQALDIDPDACRRWALDHSWARCARMLYDNLAPISSTRPPF